MPNLQYGISTFDRSRGNFPVLPVVNMFEEQVPTESEFIDRYKRAAPDVALQSRSGLMNSGLVVGDGPITNVYQNDGVLTGQVFSISEHSGSFALYSGTTLLGAIPGPGPCAIAGFQNKVFVTAGLGLYEYNGTTFSANASIVSLGWNVLSLCSGSDRLIVIDSGTGHFYWSDVISDTIQTLSFATAENSPDLLKECLYLGDTLLLFGSQTVEQWPVSTADPNLPWAPLVGRTFQVGIIGTGCATIYDSSFAWITSHNKVCLKDPDQVISSPSLEEKINLSITHKLWRFWLEGIEFLAVTLDNSTWVYHSVSGQWSTFASANQVNWIPCSYGGGYFGSSIDGNLIQWSSTFDDFGGVLERRFRAGLPLTEKVSPLFNLALRTNQGHTTYLTGTYANPTIELRTSRDGGFTWSNWKQKSFGASGQYRKQVVWTSLGYFSYPALLVEIRVTDPVPFRVSGVVYNESYGDI